LLSAKINFRNTGNTSGKHKVFLSAKQTLKHTIQAAITRADT